VTIEEYLTRVWSHCNQFKEEGHWYREVVEPWAVGIAPVKAEEYGIECWKRLGSRGLMVDISACYYRWQQLMTNGKDGENLDNALVDMFGYSAIYCICLAHEHHMPTGHYPQINQFAHRSAWSLNEWLIEHVWDHPVQNHRVLTASRQVAMQLARNAWREYH
jgi:hypothetical protein